MTSTSRSRLAHPEDSSSLSEPLAVEQVRARTGRIHLVIGPVGAGKSTFAEKLARERSALCLTLDQWMTKLFSPDRPDAGVLPWYVERAARSVDQIWSIAESVARLGTDVILEIGLLRRAERDRFYRRVTDAGLPLTVHVLEASREVRRQRVLQRNHEQGATFAMIVPPEIFELASDLWEPVNEAECDERDVRFLRTDL